MEPLVESTESAFDSFWTREHSAILALAAALTGDWGIAEDVTQDAFSAAHRNWEQIDTPEAWIRRVVANRAASHWRRRARETAALARLAARPSPVALTPEDDEFWRTVRALPRRQAQVVVLRYLDDRSVSEIAEVLQIAEGTVKATSALSVGNHEYASIDPSIEGIPTAIRRTKKWLEADTSTKPGGLNPFEPLAAFKQFGVVLDDRGTTRLDGQVVRRYHGTKRISSPPSSGGPVRHANEVFDAYVDNNGRLIRFEAVITAEGQSANLRIDFSDYGVKVNVTAPPADEVYRMPPKTSTTTPTPP